MSILSSFLSIVSGGSQGSTVAPTKVRDLMQLPVPERPTLIDVRTTGEWKQGRIAGARHMDVSASDFDGKVGNLPREGRYLLYCQSGGRSGMALSRMKSMGFTDVNHLGGGISTWKAAGYPVAK
jgi:rhodanese-related sulfurtransferase